VDLTENLFLSAGADYSVGLWQIPTDITRQNSFTEENSLESSTSLLGRFKKQQYSPGSYFMPTSCTWLKHDATSFAVSYTDPFISLYDASTGKEKGLIKFQIDEQKKHNMQQINKVIVCE
jgi:hypothetical protein